MPAIPIHPTTVAALKHIKAHGPCTLNDLRVVVPGITSKTTGNLVQLGHCMRTDDGFQITTKGREKLLSLQPTQAAPQPAAQPPSASPMLSNAEIEAAITQVLDRARVRLSIQDISRRTVLAEHLVRPTLTTMVQAGAVLASTTKPPLYSLAQQSFRQLNTHVGRGPADYPRGYTCPELARNPGIQPERFAAFALPSRINDRLHYPDGRVEPFPNMRAKVAA